tara:strand:+ start:4886 stop:5068 length:183 start_codon:yes stop_codon:yes gene_type:complete
MISPLEIKRTLKHCEKIDKKYKQKEMVGDEGTEYFEYVRNQGWCQALRFILEKNTIKENN